MQYRLLEDHKQFGYYGAVVTRDIYLNSIVWYDRPLFEKVPQYQSPFDYTVIHIKKKGSSEYHIMHLFCGIAEVIEHLGKVCPDKAKSAMHILPNSDMTIQLDDMQIKIIYKTIEL